MPYMTKRTPTQLEQMRIINRRAYLKRKGGILTRVTPSQNTIERKLQRNRDKQAIRCTRAKQARFYDGFTDLVVREAHDLRKLRNVATGIEWHVDHVVPLKGEHVCGLHIWSNLAVIPKVINLRKGNICPI
jgi:hypothetical protein